MPCLWLGCYLWSKPRSLLPAPGGPSGVDEPICIICVIQPEERTYSSWLPFSSAFTSSFFKCFMWFIPSPTLLSATSTIGNVPLFWRFIPHKNVLQKGQGQLVTWGGQEDERVSQSRTSTNWREVLFEATMSVKVLPPSFVKNVNKIVGIVVLWGWHIVCLL